MVRYLERAYRYLPMMKKVLKDEELPEDLIFVPLIESGFSHSAHSHASAVGYWQFVRETGKRFGLVINQYVDERRDPLLSTKAAAKYLKYLYGMFGNWYLALASYNTGENRVKRTVARYKTKDFWVLAKRKKFYRETINYIPKFQAARLIFKNKELYGFKDLSLHDPVEYDEISTSFSISLLKLAKHLDVKYKKIKYLNPIFTSDFVPVKNSPVTLRVPKGLERKALKYLELSKASKPVMIERYHIWYRVRAGDSLYKIARRYKTSIRVIKRLNGLKRSLIRPGQKLKILKNVKGSKKFYVIQKKHVKMAASTGYHRVKAGQNLSGIARRYKIPLKKLKKLNNLTHTSMIYPGQKIKLTEKARTKVKVNRQLKKYRVKAKDSLYSIAKKYKINLKDIRSANPQLKKYIHPGQILRIPASKGR